MRAARGMGTYPSTQGQDRRRRAIEHGVLLAFGVGLALRLVHAEQVAYQALPPVLLWLRDSILALPLALGAASLGSDVSLRLLRWSGTPDDQERGAVTALVWALPAATIYALVVLPATFVHVSVFPLSQAVQPPASATAPGNAATAMLVGLAVLLLARLTAFDLRVVASTLRRPVTRRRMVAFVVAPTVALVLVTIPLPGSSQSAPAEAAAPRCDASATPDRTYEVWAINVHIPYNRWGEGNENGMVYALRQDVPAIRDWHKPLGTTGSNRRLRPRPLVIRANEGECVAVTFTNRLDAQQGSGLPDNPRASMFVRGVPFDVQTSGGSHVGYNDDTTVGIGESTTYYWQAPQEGIYFYNDTAMPAGSEADGGSLAHGLYGAFVVEPEGSAWTDPVSGDPLYTGTLDQSGELYIDAVITRPNGHSFRETVQLAQDELPNTSAFAFNYGSEPIGNRDPDTCPDCVGEETSLSSWVYGDPALVKLASGLGPWLPGTPAGSESCGLGTDGFEADSCFTANVTHAYPGDATKIRYGMAGVKETHVFHMHAHQWLSEPDDVGDSGRHPSRPRPGADPQSNIIDSQTFGPMEMFTADLLFGAGSKNGTVGDSIFHCHLYPHFAEGFWALFRVHDVREDGTGSTPDGVKVWELQPLPSAQAPPAPTADNPGFPRFIPGEVGWRPPQAPLSVTRDGVPEPRYVAGEPLDPAGEAVQVERTVMERMSGGESKPGAPFNDPCPEGAREVTYNVSAIQTRAVYNERGDFDSQARILVLDRDVEAVLSGRKKPEPLFARVNAGDCVTWRLTNRIPNWYGNDAFQQLIQTNMFGQHIHLVKFDVLASDGSTNGWNYQQAAYSGLQDDFNDQIADNPSSCTDTRCRLDLPDDYDPFTTSADVPVGQTITERWYVDYDLRTVFTHDHHFAATDQNRGNYGALVVEPKGMDFRNPVSGAWYQPINDEDHGTPCGGGCVGGAAGTAMDVIGPGADDDFREFGLAIADFVPLTRGGGDPQNPNDVLNPPPAPEPYPSEDPGVMAVNYRNAPLELRRTKNGHAVDPAYAFSSYVFGDPMTPVLQTYNGDNVRVRLIQGSQEEQHIVQFHGVRWKKEPGDPQSHLVDAMPVGVSEAFNFQVPRLGCASGQDCRGDYLFSSDSSDDLLMGMWGILRVHGGKVPRLLPLPDNPQHRTGSVPGRSPTALAPPERVGPGNPCPAGAPRRGFDVVAMQTEITYNEAGDHDPFGLVYALEEDAPAIRKGQNPEPLVLRANEGDCIEVTLTNELTPDFQQHRGEGDAKLPGRPADYARVPGLRVSMHAGLLKYDVRGSDGATVGFSRDQTVGPGESILYRWYADDVTPGELGAVNLTDYGDVLGHRHHGLFGGLIVEPEGATWHDPATGEPIESGASADIRVPDGDDFREATVFFQDGLNLRRADGSFIEDPTGHPPAPGEPVEGLEALDAEDSGEKAFNYRSEPFRNRLGYEPVNNAGPGGEEMAEVYDSHTHGDPSTPIFRAYEGDHLRMRVLQGGDKPRQHAFGLAGHSFPISPEDPDSRRVGTISGLGVGTAVNAHMGPTNDPGDYLYGCMVRFFHRSGGLWGFLRVYPQPEDGTALLPTRIGATDDPRAGGHPLMPLEVDQVQARVFDDEDHDGARDRGEPWVPGVRLRASQSGSPGASPGGSPGASPGGQLRTSAVSGEDGWAYLSVRPGRYALSVVAPDGYDVGRVPDTVSTSGNNDVRHIQVALQDPTGSTTTPTTEPAPRRATLRARAFYDRDWDGRRDARERMVRRVRVRLLQRGRSVASARTRAGGTARLRVPPGRYSVHVNPPGRYRVGHVPRRVRAGRPGSVRTFWVALQRRPARIRAVAFLDRDRDGRRDRRDRAVRRVRVTVVHGRVRDTDRTNRRGRAWLQVPARVSQRVRVRRPRRFAVVAAPRRVRPGRPGSTRAIRIALRRRR